MKFLFISISYPKNLQKAASGIQNRMRLFIDALKDLGHIDMLFFVGPSVDTSDLSVKKNQNSLSEYFGADITLFLCPINIPETDMTDWDIYGAGIFNFFKQMPYKTVSNNQQIKTIEQCLERNPDVIFVHRLRSMCPLLLTHYALPPVFFDLDDIEHLSFLRNISQPPVWRSKHFFYLQIPALLLGERRAVRLSKRTFVCSDRDCAYLKKITGSSGIFSIHNAVDIPELKPITKDKTFLFLGTYGFRPNVNAAEFLIERVWPYIRQAVPDARLIIAGKSPHNIRGSEKGISGVEFTGFVDDIDKLYERTRVVCAPILSGSGTRIKIIEAAAFGKQIVSTRIGAEGLEFEDDKEILLHDNPRSFAKACITLLGDNELCENIGMAARKKASQLYKRENIVNLIQQHIKQAV